MGKISAYLKSAAAILPLLLCSCIKDTTPYPTIQGRITGMTVDGLLNIDIDQNRRTVNLTLDESTDLSQVILRSITLSDGAEAPLQAGAVMNLREPYHVTVSTYQKYEWTITAQQQIERVFVIENQMGQTRFEEFSRRAFAYVPKGTDLSCINVLSLKLGPKDRSTCSPAVSGLTDFRNGVRVTVSYDGKNEMWTLFVTQTSTTVTGIDAWAKSVWLRGVGNAGADNGFEYRRADSETWLTVSGTQEIQGEISAKITGLEPATAYVCRSYSDGEYSQDFEFTTESAPELPGGSFDFWHKAGKTWNPWEEGGSKYWDTGNPGAVTIGESNSVPSDDACEANPEGRSAYLETRFAGIGSLGKLAGGNIYVGSYAGTDGTNGLVDMGREFSGRPTRLVGYFKYSPRPIDNVSKEFDASQWKGKPDTCHICIALGDWDAPYQVRTKPTDRAVFNSKVPGIVAFGEIVHSGTVSEWTRFEIELDYRSTSIKPRYLLLFCTASKWADYFTGGTGSLLQVDEFRLEYN